MSYTESKGDLSSVQRNKPEDKRPIPVCAVLDQRQVLPRQRRIQCNVDAEPLAYTRVVLCVMASLPRRCRQQRVGEARLVVLLKFAVGVRVATGAGSGWARLVLVAGLSAC